jgi:hypothetical protein
LTTSALSVGSHSITAQYIGNNNFKPSTSPAFTLIVKKEPIFQHPLSPVACGIFVTVIGCFIHGSKFKKNIKKHSKIQKPCLLLIFKLN